jgi:hypothetical protein
LSVAADVEDRNWMRLHPAISNLHNNLMQSWEDETVPGLSANC